MSFTFNKHGVCENPEEVKVYRSGKDFITIELAERPDGKWSFGYNYQIHSGGGGGGLPNLTYDPHSTRKGALLAGISYHKNRADEYRKQKHDKSEAVAYERAYKALLQYETSLYQLSLFDLL